MIWYENLELSLLIYKVQKENKGTGFQFAGWQLGHHRLDPIVSCILQLMLKVEKGR